MVASSVENTLVAGEGVATVSEPGHSPYELYRGIESVPDAQKTQGWTHIGDPDSIHGYIFDAYQGPSSGNSKMFLVTTPSGQSFEYSTLSSRESCTTTRSMPYRRIPNGWSPANGGR